jgi:hypothetical protein
MRTKVVFVSFVRIQVQWTIHQTDDIENQNNMFKRLLKSTNEESIPTDNASPATPTSPTTPTTPITPILTPTVESGHLFIVQGDLTKFSCDVYGIPCNYAGQVTEPWRHGLSLEEFTDIVQPDLRQLNDNRVSKIRSDEWKRRTSSSAQPWLIVSGGIYKSLEWVSNM